MTVLRQTRAQRKSTCAANSSLNSEKHYNDLAMHRQQREFEELRNGLAKNNEMSQASALIELRNKQLYDENTQLKVG